jgi:hypothetical protein
MKKRIKQIITLPIYAVCIVVALLFAAADRTIDFLDDWIYR